jgi:hypothetical protein
MPNRTVSPRSRPFQKPSYAHSSRAIDLRFCPPNYRCNLELTCNIVEFRRTEKTRSDDGSVA